MTYLGDAQWLCRLPQGLCCAALAWSLPAWGADPLLYACPVGEGRAVYASEPLNVECQPAKRPAPVADALEAAETEIAQRLYYQNEFGGMDDVEVLPRRPPPLKIRLRQAAPPPKPAILRPAPPPPKPPTPRQLIRRDIAAEERALQRTRKALQQAQKQGKTAESETLRKNIADREANIRALQQELQRK